MSAPQEKIWGTNTEIFFTDTMSINVLHIDKGGTCSLHTHKSKYNKFHVISGELKLRVEFFDNRDDVGQILLGVNEEDQEMVNVKWGPNLKFFGVKVFFGGEQRFDTVARGLELLKEDIELVAVHLT